VGRFLNQDSYLGESNTPPSLHRYLYAYANPTVYIDLDGHEAMTKEEVRAQSKQRLNERNAQAESEDVLEFDRRTRVEGSEQIAARKAELEQEKNSKTEEAEKGPAEQSQTDKNIAALKQRGLDAFDIDENTVNQGAASVVIGGIIKVAGELLPGKKVKQAKELYKKYIERNKKKSKKRENGNFDERKQKRIEENERLKKEREDAASQKGTIKSSETIGKPVEAVIGNRKRLLRVDIEPNGKLQIQSGAGKDSIVDFRPDLSKPLAPQINKAFKRLPKSSRDQLIKNAEKGLKKLQSSGNM